MSCVRVYSRGGVCVSLVGATLGLADRPFSFGRRMTRIITVDAAKATTTIPRATAHDRVVLVVVDGDDDSDCQTADAFSTHRRVIDGNSVSAAAAVVEKHIRGKKKKIITIKYENNDILRMTNG